MAIPLVPVAISLGVTTVVSLSGNIVQAIQNRKLRKQIEKLHRIIENLNNDLAEARKELHALKIWCFRQRIAQHKEISGLKKERKERVLKLNNLVDQYNAA